MQNPPKGSEKRPRKKGLFLCFTTYFAFFLPKNLLMSDNCCTFAAEIGIDMQKLRRVKRSGQRWGATCKE